MAPRERRGGEGRERESDTWRDATSYYHASMHGFAWTGKRVVWNWESLKRDQIKFVRF